jgi:fatty acid/phospholipid biosynthesis enzyme
MLLNNAADVVVADGFVGNLVLKFGEAVFKLATSAAARNIRRSLRCGRSVASPRWRWRWPCPVKAERGLPWLA